MTHQQIDLKKSIFYEQGKCPIKNFKTLTTKNGPFDPIDESKSKK
jgi:hypothetical protein